MNMAMEVGVYGGAIPFAVALALIYLIRRFASLAVFDRLAMAAAFALAFFVAWAVLPDSWTPLSPQRQWHWLPYLGLLAAVLSAAGYAKNAWAPQRAATNLLTAAIAAWLLAPTWPDLEPPRYVYVLLFGGYLFALITLLDALPDRLLGRHFPWLLFAASSATAIVIAEPVSLQYGQVAGVSAAALLGCSAAAWLGVSGPALRGLIPVYAVLVGGIAFSGSIEPEPPLYAILLAPVLPLALWICAYGPLARLSGRKAIIVHWLVALVPLACLIGWVLMGGEPEDEWSEY